MSDVSAMSVARTTRRRPAGDGARARSCSSSAQRPGERAYVDRVADDADESVAAAHDLADAGEEHEDVAVVLGQRPDDGSFDGALEAVLALPRQPADVHRVGPSGDLDDRRRIGSDAGEEASEPRRVSGRRHRQDAQVGPQRRGHVEGQRQAEVGRQVALVNLVEDHGGDARQLRVALQAPSQHAFGEHLDACRRADTPLVAGLVADQFADPLPGEVGHPPRGRPRRQPPRLEHHDLAVAAPRRIEQRERHDRRLAGAWRRADDATPGDRSSGSSRSTMAPGRSGTIWVGQSRCRVGGRGASLGGERLPPESSAQPLTVGRERGVRRARACRGTDRGRRRSGCRATARPSSWRSSRRPLATRLGSIPRRRPAPCCRHG